MSDGLIEYDVRANTDNFEQDLDNANKKAEAGAGKLGSIAKAGGAAVAAGFAAVGTAAIAAGGYAVNLANDMDSAMNSFAASTGIADTQMEGFQSVLEGIYANNYGDSFQDIAEAMALVNKNLGDMSPDSMQEVTEAAFALRDTFEYDIAESTRAAKAMMDNFGVSGEEAFELIAAGAQNNLDFSGEMLDSISEYSVQFQKLGFTADDMFNIFQKGADNGAWNLDKVGDAIKEFSIRAIDCSDSTTVAFQTIGLNADEMASAFAAGGETAKQAFFETLAALESIEDPVERNIQGVALFGTMWEDLGPEAVAQLASIEDSAYSAGEALKGIEEIKYNDLGSMFEGLTRSVEMLVLPLGEALIPVLNDLIEVVLPVVQEALPGVVDAFKAFLEPILELAGEALPGLIDGFSKLMSDDVMPLLIDEILPALLTAFESLEPVFELFKDEMLPLIIDLFKELLPPILDLANILIPMLVDIFLALAEPVMDFIENLLPSLKSLLLGVNEVVSALSPVIDALAVILETSLGNAFAALEPIIDHITTVFANLIDFVKNVFKGDWEAAWGNIVECFRSCFDLIPTIAGNVINNAVDGLNSFISGVNKLTGKIPGNPIGTIPLIDYPSFHTGGIIDFKGRYEAPIMALDGEMVLTAAQQKRLFDIANGMYTPESVSGGDNISNRTEVKIEHKNYFTVRNDGDITRISEELSRQEAKDIMSLGGR